MCRPYTTTVQPPSNSYVTHSLSHSSRVGKTLIRVFRLTYQRHIRGRAAGVIGRSIGGATFGGYCAIRRTSSDQNCSLPWLVANVTCVHPGHPRKELKRKFRKVVWSLFILTPIAYALEVPDFSASAVYTSGGSAKKTKNPRLSVCVFTVWLGEATVTSTSAAGCPRSSRT